jgi:hypothetical protein
MYKDDRTFAYGANCIEDTPCPATAAGYNPDFPPDGQIAEEYDATVETRVGERKGTIDEQTARECWLEAVEISRARVENLEGCQLQCRARKITRVGGEIAEELGWV